MDANAAVTSDDLKTDLKVHKEDKEDKVIMFLLIIRNYNIVVTVYAYVYILLLSYVYNILLFACSYVFMYCIFDICRWMKFY